MNRRIFVLTSISLLSVGSSAGVARSKASAPVTAEVTVLSKRLGPASRNAVFSGMELSKAKGQLALRPIQNGIWIEHVNWTGQGGGVHHIHIGRNIPRGARLVLPNMSEVRQIDIGLTCLPLGARQTTVELSVGGVCTDRLNHTPDGRRRQGTSFCRYKTRSPFLRLAEPSGTTGLRQRTLVWRS
jgi:hypothetical protein